MSPNEKFDKLYLIALRFLAHKARSEYEVRERLKKYLLKKAEPLDSPEIEEVINTLKNERYINDAEYVSSYINYQISSQKKSLLVIKRFLLSKGIDRELISEKLSTLDVNEKDTVKAAAQKKYNTIKDKGLSPLKMKQKLMTFLLGKGFSHEDVIDAVDSVLGVK